MVSSQIGSAGGVGRRNKYVHNRFFDYPVSHLSELEQFIFLAVVEKKAALGFSN